MDHSWGKNVSDKGLAGMGATLAARVLGSGNVWLTNAIEYPGDLFTYVLIPSDTNPDASYYIAAAPTGGQHFPYGYDVEPDVPG